VTVARFEVSMGVMATFARAFESTELAGAGMDCAKAALTTESARTAATEMLRFFTFLFLPSKY
jgi:hypothetical protein